MAKGKRQHRYPTTKTAPSGTAEPRRKPRGPLDLVDYALLNVLFAAFCLVQLLIARMLLPDMLGLYFFFGFLVGAFVLVSSFDYMATRVVTPEQAGMEAEQT